MLGIKEIYIEDLREEFVRDYVFPMFRANALYEGVYLSARQSPARSSPSARLKLPRRRVPMPYAMAPPAKAMIRCGLNWAIMPAIRIFA